MRWLSRATRRGGAKHLGNSSILTDHATSRLSILPRFIAGLGRNPTRWTGSKKLTKSEMIASFTWEWTPLVIRFDRKRDSATSGVAWDYPSKPVFIEE